MTKKYIVAAAWQHIFEGNSATETRWAIDLTSNSLVVAQYKEKIGGRWRALAKGDCSDLLESLRDNGVFEHPGDFDVRAVIELPSWADSPTGLALACA